MAAGVKARDVTASMTPTRRSRVALHAQQNYFEPGKVGRKTGITLHDTGVRDENGLEPVSGIFSSPVESHHDDDRTLGSDDMAVQYSKSLANSAALMTASDLTSGSAPEVAETLVSRSRTPRLPPPRSATPKHTNLGSPKRLSTARRQTRPRAQDEQATHSQSPKDSPRAAPTTSRRLDFQTNNVRTSIENIDPFRPRKPLRRSDAPMRPDAYELAPSPGAAPSRSSSGSPPTPLPPVEIDEGEEQEKVGGGGEEYFADNYEPDLDTARFSQDAIADYGADPGSPLVTVDMDEIEAAADEQQSPSRRSLATSRSRKSLDDVSRAASPRQALSKPVTPPKKRSRASVEVEELGDASDAVEDDEPMPSVEERLSKSPRLTVHTEHGTETIDPSLLAHGDEYMVEEPVEPSQEPAKTKGKRKGKAKAPANRKPAAQSSAAAASPSRRSASRAGSIGPVSNVHLRSTTPFEDAEGRTSRYGRTLTQPLKYWANETRVYKHGEIEGVVRAEEVEKPAHTNRGKKPNKKRSRKTPDTKLEDIEEVSDAESLFPDDWEEEIGVIAGAVARWNGETQTGDTSEPVREDLAFASSAIVTREAIKAEFRFAKIMTLPFFGSGIVEMPPGGYKREKPSGRMQMVFFVHDGKVSVEIGAEGIEINRFSVSKGGAWVVPRGNRYAITNESRTRTARIFFAQGCEVNVTADTDTTTVAQSAT